MSKVSKRGSLHKKQSFTFGSNTKNGTGNGGTSSSINKHYSVDDNFHTYMNRSELYGNCTGNNYFTKCNTVHRYRFSKQESSSDRLPNREDASFKKFFKVFNSGANSRGAKDWFTTSANNMRDFAPKILTKRFCGKKGENELYRSDSFKFERFERTDSDTLSSSRKSPVSRQIDLCDDYSLPVDFVNKRPVSLDSGSFWSAPSSNVDRVEVLNLYCDPKDSAKIQNLVSNEKILKGGIAEVSAEVPENKLALYSIVQKSRKDQIKTVRDSSEDEYEDDEPKLYENLKHRKLTALSRPAQKGSTYTEVRKPPYYYSDLLKRSQSEEKPNQRCTELNLSCKCQSLDIVSKNESMTKGAKYVDQYLNSFDLREDDEEGEDMAGKLGHMYETAFDSKIHRSNETLDLDVTNHVIERCSLQLPCHSLFCQLPGDCKYSLKHLKNTKNKLELSNKFESSVDSISQQLTDLDMNEQSTLLHGYSSASTSTFPLLQSISSIMNDSLDSFSESSHKGSLCHSDNFFSEEEKRVKSSNSPVYSNYINNNNNNDNGKRHKNISNLNNTRHHRHHKHKLPFNYHNDDSCCIFDSPNDSHPKGCQLNSKILKINSRVRERSGKFSNTGSMTTSSSDGSLESIRSSTSEGNRNTTSTSSNRSSSLSSHSSDSAVGSHGTHLSTNHALGIRFLNQSKMHVLFPISDKSFQEAGTECSEANRKSNSQKGSPEENRSSIPDGLSSDSLSAVSKIKKCSLQNMTNVRVMVSSEGDVETQQCSDSGISSESKSDTVKQNQNSDLNDFFFDMPKLRRRRLQQIQLAQSYTQDTLSSAMSIDVNDLSFDMPKLRPKLRSLSTEESTELPLDADDAMLQVVGVKQSEDNMETQGENADSSKNRRSLGLILNLNDVLPDSFNIDADIPLERQGWYHGAISRLEAENELRNKTKEVI